MSEISPVQLSPGDHAANAVHAHLRRLILEGILAPGASINQVTLAAELGVSRTPVREAIRMLQEEGLVIAEPQKRARVRGFDPDHLESVYSQRVLLESVAASLTAASADAALIERLEHFLGVLQSGAGDSEESDWRDEHKSFHLALVSGVEPHFLRAIRANIDRSEHYHLNYRLLYGSAGSRRWDTSPGETRAIVAAYRRRDGGAAAIELAAHLARTALSLLAQLAPDRDPVVLRAALRMVRSHGDGH